MKKLKSPCCKATIGMALADGVVVGMCNKCFEYVFRVNRKTETVEWLDGESPWTTKKLRKACELGGITR